MTVTNNNEKNALAQEQAKHLMMSEILERYYHTGKHNKVCCPFHEEKTPSFTYKEGIFTCFGCGAKGDQVEFVRKYFDLDYIDALKKIDQDFGFGVYDNELSDDERKKIRDRQVLRERQRKVEQAFELEYIKACDELAEVDKKLIEIRKHGISDDNVIEYTSLLKTYEEKGYIVQDMEDQRRLREMGKRSQAIYNKPQNAAAKFPERKKCMKLEIHTRPNPKANKDAAKKILGWANLTVNDRITVCDIAIYQPEEGKKSVIYPSYINNKGDRVSFAFPNNPEDAEIIRETILNTFRNDKPNTYVAGEIPEIQKLEVKNVSPVKNNTGKIRALAALNIECMHVSSIKVITTKNDGLYVVTPTNGKYIDQKTGKEVYKDAFRIENDEMKHQMIERVLDKYKRSISKDTEQNLEDIPIHDGKDYFYNRPEINAVEGIYYNPDATSGGQFVRAQYPYSLIAEANNRTEDVEQFFAYLNDRARMELIDKGTVEYENMMQGLKNSNPLAVGRSEDNKLRLSLLAGEYLNTRTFVEPHRQTVTPTPSYATPSHVKLAMDAAQLIDVAKLFQQNHADEQITAVNAASHGVVFRTSNGNKYRFVFENGNMKEYSEPKMMLNSEFSYAEVQKKTTFITNNKSKGNEYEK